VTNKACHENRGNKFNNTRVNFGQHALMQCGTATSSTRSDAVWHTHANKQAPSHLTKVKRKKKLGCCGAVVLHTTAAKKKLACP